MFADSASFFVSVRFRSNACAYPYRSGAVSRRLCGRSDASGCPECERLSHWLSSTLFAISSRIFGRIPLPDWPGRENCYDSEKQPGMRVVRFSASPPGRLFMASSHAGLQFPIRRQFLVRLFVGENRQIPGAFFLGRNVHFFLRFSTGRRTGPHAG